MAYAGDFPIVPDGCGDVVAAFLVHDVADDLGAGFGQTGEDAFDFGSHGDSLLGDVVEQRARLGVL
jgi:hypothetical protein